MHKIEIGKCTSTSTIRKFIFSTLANVNFPESLTASILIKPNLNSNMNALTGNTTDLRLLSAVVEFLKDKGYKNIIIGEGTNSGYYRRGLNVISRLKVDKLAKYYGAKIIDLNYEPSIQIDFEDGVKAEAARICVESDFFINIPKLKTHYETEMSVCLKSLMGCLVGFPNKKKTHSSLIKNIYNINKVIKPNLQIVDGIIAMEGTGPTKGTPINLGIVMVGTNPFLLDLASARLSKIPYKEIPLLKLAEDRGDIDSTFHKYLDDINIDQYALPFRRPKISWLTALVTNKRLQKYFLKIRHSPIIRDIFNSNFGNRLLFKLGLTQEIFHSEECENITLILNKDKCKSIGKCSTYCPVNLNLPLELQNERCIKCLYCYCVCPNNAIVIDGDIGFFKEQIKQYDEIIRAIA